MTHHPATEIPPHLPPVELISVHVPKSAGTTFSHILARQYGVGLYMDYGHEPIHPALAKKDPEIWRREQAEKAALLPAPTRVIHGHFWAGKYDQIFPGAKKITWLREPVQRLISHYFYFKSHPDLPHPINHRLHEQNLSLLDFARLPALQNVLTRRWLRDTPLSAFDFVGVQEHFAADLAALQRDLGWNPVEITRENPTLHEEYERARADAAAFAELEELNRADLELYRAALALRPR